MLTLRALIVVALSLLSAGGLAIQSVYGQIPGLPDLLAGDKAAGKQPPPRVTRQGEIETTGVYLDGRQLFEIASPTVPDRTQPGALIPVELRAQEVEGRLQRLLLPDAGVGKTGNVSKTGKLPERTAGTRLDPASLRVRIETRNGQSVLFATDERAGRSDELVSVTDTDAQYQGLGRPELAAHWQEILQSELRTALEKRQPEVERLRPLRVIGILAGALLFSILLGKLSAVLTKRKEVLWEEEQRAEQQTASHAAESQAATAKAAASRQAAADPQHTGTPDTLGIARDAEDAARNEQRERSLLSQVLGEQRRIARRRRIVLSLLWLISWTIIFAWVAAIAGVFYEFPTTRGFADRIVAIPVLILVAGLVAGLVNALAGFLIDRIANSWSRSDDARSSLRVPTVVAALKGLTSALLYVGAFVAVLEFVFVIPFSVVALGAVVALALSLAAQNLVKDVVNGLLILLDDQYALGDEVAIGGASGVVERLNLRITQLRTPDGRLITIPNHTVAQVENKTRLWSQADIRITVDYSTDVDRAIAVVDRVAQETARDPQWRPLILAPHHMLGVEEVTHAGIVIRFLLKTLPFKKEDVARELRRRLKIAFDREGIRIGIPQQAIVVEADRAAAQPNSASDGREDLAWRTREKQHDTANPH